MIQRIQSIYLLLTAILMAVTVFSSLVVLNTDAEGVLVFLSCGIYEAGSAVYPTWGVITFAALSTLLACISIFLFKKRKMQIKLCNLNTLLIIFFYITFAIYLYTGMSALQATFLKISHGIILPIIALIFNILATVKIKADEKLIKSLDRIR
ncbi:MULTISPECIES: DUF4293 domain-containing protein [unclassified Dysgonomonas]|uniref:DUF4293 domain-containing protein n=1 Tax=unclassified Dysgonomonas TaxID=2630389 RepID=UPI0013ECE78F|nr:MULTISPECIES: DUF4293 domain-containing protein [unclassified Dysgonomonas]